MELTLEDRQVLRLTICSLFIFGCQSLIMASSQGPWILLERKKSHNSHNWRTHSNSRKTDTLKSDILKSDKDARSHPTIANGVKCVSRILHDIREFGCTGLALSNQTNAIQQKR